MLISLPVRTVETKQLTAADYKQLTTAVLLLKQPIVKVLKNVKYHQVMCFVVIGCPPPTPCVLTTYYILLITNSTVRLSRFMPP